MSGAINRRGVLAIGGAVAAAGGLPAAAALPAEAGEGVLLFDPALPAARAIAAAAKGQRLVALSGDPVRLWRDMFGDHRGPVAGVTRWSDYLILRGLAEERGLRVKREVRIELADGPLVLDWAMA